MSLFSECGLRGGNHSSDFLTEKGAGHIAIAFEPENTDALLVVAGHGKRGCIHNGEMGEDEGDRLLKELDKITKQTTDELDTLLEAKQKEIMEV